jgi:surfeit locus 1 family protein
LARKSFFLLSGSAAIALAIMLALGAWQVERLAWKNELIATIDARVNAAPIPLPEMLDDARTGGDIRYLRITATGEFDFDKEIYLFTFNEQGPGRLVFSPFATDQGVLIVNRGFVPETNRDSSLRPDTGDALQGPTTIAGLARIPERQTAFVPDNEPTTNNWYWRDLDGMAVTFGVAPEKVVPFFLDLQLPAPEGGLPMPGLTRIELSNRHLEYAITWFGLAAVFMVIFVVFLRKQLRQTP